MILQNKHIQKVQRALNKAIAAECSAHAWWFGLSCTAVLKEWLAPVPERVENVVLGGAVRGAESDSLGSVLMESMTVKRLCTEEGAAALERIQHY